VSGKLAERMIIKQNEREAEVILADPHPLTQSPNHPITQSPSHPVTLSLPLALPPHPSILISTLWDDRELDSVNDKSPSTRGWKTSVCRFGNYN